MTSALRRRAVPALALAVLLLSPVAAVASEASLVLPDLNQVEFLGGIPGKTLLFSGLGVSVIGLLFGLMMYSQLKNLPVHKSMLEVSELIYETCKTYLIHPGEVPADAVRGCSSAGPSTSTSASSPSSRTRPAR